MDFLNRSIKSLLNACLLPNKVFVLLGPRRVGKTVLIRQLLAEMLNGEDQYQGTV